MGKFESLIFYIIFFIISYIFYYLYNKHNKKIFLFFAFLIPFIIGGFRFNVGTDYGSYIKLYYGNINVDQGFTIISWIARIFNDHNIIFLLYNTLTLIFVFLGIKNLNKEIRPLVYFIYLFVFYTTSFNAMRQMLAVSIVFFAYQFINKKDFIKYFIFLLLAFCFHNSSLLSLLLYPILISKNKKIKILSVIILMICVVYYQQIITSLSNVNYFSHFEIYTEYNGELGFNNFTFFLEMLIFCYILCFKKTLFNIDEFNNNYIYIFTLGLVLIFSGFFSPYIKRIAIFFTICSIILLGYIPYIQKNNKNRLLHYLIVIFISIFRFVLSAYILEQGNIIPYNFL